MAAADEKTLCSTCGKGNGRIRCEGCSKIFCLNDFNGHQQELGKQVEEIEVTRDLFRQTLTEKISEPQKHVLIEQIDEWENESINQIRQAAEEARKMLLQHTAELNTKLEYKLNKLTNEIRQSREENDFFEPKISHWRKELTQMENELAKPSSVTMRKDPTPLVTKINVDISDARYDEKSGGTTHLSIKEKYPQSSRHSVFKQINDSAGLVTCSFCEEEFSSLAIGEHLMTCGNKTDHCLNCGKHIRRAIFAYHYENNCANLEESDTEVRAPANQFDTLSTFQPNNPSQSPSRSAVENNMHRTEMTVDLPAPSGTEGTAAQRFGSATTTSVCLYCYNECDPMDIEMHQENCLQNPQNIAKRQQSRNDPTSTQNSGLDRLNYVDEPKDADEIPCEICNKTIKWSNYRNHMQLCATQRNPRIQDSQHASRMDGPDYARCRYCDKKYMIATLEMHQKACRKNPVNITVEEQHRRIFNSRAPNKKFS